MGICDVLIPPAHPGKGGSDALRGGPPTSTALTHPSSRQSVSQSDRQTVSQTVSQVSHRPEGGGGVRHSRRGCYEGVC